MILKTILLLVFFIFNNLKYLTDEEPLFIPPLKIPILLSANFAESRSDHFHSGLDIKTQSVTGKKVVASASGFIYRISVSPGGFGKALYIRHPSGYSTVYGHLEEFAVDIEEYVKIKQYERKSYQVNLFPGKSDFPVSQGQIIGYSGNSGSSTGPHLHYEIRKSENEEPVNPLLFDIGTKDNIKPVIEQLVIYRLSNKGTDNGSNMMKFNVTGNDGEYFLPDGRDIEVSGLTGFGIKSYDLLNNSNNRCAAYAIELFIDSIPVFGYKMDNFSFSDTRFVNSHIDYETYIKERIFIERLFILPNDRLNIYTANIDRGIINFSDENSHNIDIIVTDAHGNKSSLSFEIMSKPYSSAIDKPKEGYQKIMPYNRRNEFENNDIALTIPEGSLYDTLFFSYSSGEAEEGMLSDIHHIHDIYTPLHKAALLRIKPHSIPEGLEPKMLIIKSVNDNDRIAVNGNLEDGYIKTEILTLGDYYVGIDTVSPVITPAGLYNGKDLGKTDNIRIRISDDLSGIGSYEGFIDGKWALFEYDGKNNLLVYRFDDKRINRETEHNLILRVTDNRNNISSYECDFSW